MAYTAYLNTVQKIYMGYYQRPADPGGLIHWATQLDGVGGNLNQIIANFAGSAESTALYGTINSTTISGVVNQIYGALFNRSAEPGGLAYWVGEFNAGRLTAATIMLSILNGAQGADLVSVNNKLDAANLFTNTIDPGLNGPPYEANYSNVLDARDTRLDVIDARTWLSGVTSNVGTIPTQVETTAFIQAHIANLGDPILGTAPVAQPAAANVAEDAAVINGYVSATDVDGGVLTFALNNPAPSGLTFNANGTYSFNPANAAYQSLGVGQSAILTVPFTVTDNVGLTGTANLVITVTGTNDAPIAAAKVAAGLEDNTILVTPSSSDVDTGDTATYSVNTQPANGTVSFNAGTGNFAYIPNANFNGVDSFTYKVTDAAGAVSTATVSLTVTAVNDAPVANNAAASGNEDTLIAGAVTTSDIENDPLTYSVVTPPTKGAVTLNADGTFTYTPNLNTNGADTFTYRVNDGSANSNTAIVTLTVTPVNDAPVAASSAATTAEDNAVSGYVSATDVDNATLTYSITGAPSNGTVAITNATTGAYTYTPSPNFNGSDSFIFTASDGTLTSSAAVSINITPVNDAPVANNGTASGFEDLPILGNVVASDVDGNTLNYTVVNQPIDAANPLNPAGTVVMNATTGAFTYTPTPDFNGTATFTYRVNDGTVNSNTATVTLTVTPVDEVLTPGTDTILGNADDEVIVGANHNLNAGDSINGGGGTDTLILSIDATNTPQTYGGFMMDNVEKFIVTNDDTEPVTFDMSSSENVQTLTSLNSSEDVTFNYANTNAMPGGTFVNLVVDNLTKAVDVSLDLRNDDVTGSNDQVNLLVIDSDDASYPDVGDINIMQIGTDPDLSGNKSGIEVVNLSTEGSIGSVEIRDLNTPGATRLNIDTDVTLTIGEVGDGPGTVDALDIERPLNRSVNYVDASGSTGNITLSTERNDTSATILMGSGNDFIATGDGPDYITGGQGNDSIAAGSGNNTVYGNEGNDVIRTLGGHDTIYGGTGNDNINAGDGNNYVYGEEGNDTIVTGSGTDVIYGGDGNDDITFGAGSDYVYGEAGNDTIRAGANLASTYTESWGWPWTGGPDEIYGGSGIDTLILTGDSGDANELDGVWEVENIILQGGAYSISVTDNSLFDTDIATSTTIDATAIGGTLMFNGNDGVISGYGGYDDGVLSRAITVLGGSGNDTITTGLGADYISGGAGDDRISSGDGNDTVATGTGIDSVLAGSGDDQIIVQGGELTAADTINGVTGNDRITIVNSSWSGYENETANLGINVSNIDTIDVDDQDGWNNNDVTVTFEAAYNQTGITVDGSSLDSGERLIVNTAAQDGDGDGVTENFTIIGGAGNDLFNMGNNLGGDSINGNAGGDTLKTEGTIVDGAFVGVSSMEILQLTEAGLADNVTLAANAQAAGITQVGGTGQADVIDASAYTAGIYVWGAAGDDTITTGSGNDTIYGDAGSDVINSGAGNDTIYIGDNLPGDFVNAGIGDDTVVVYLNQLGNGVGIWVGNDDTLIGGLGNDTVKLSNASGPVNAGVNLTNVTGFENFTAAFEDQANPNVENDVNITFTGGNVATLTTINVSGAALTDGLDDLNVDLSGLGDADFAFNITGGAGDDAVTGSVLAENLNFSGGLGNDWLNAPGGDLGTTVTMDGGGGTGDTINVTTGKVTDDSFVSISSVEHLTASTALDAQLGAKADAAGIISITGAAGNDTVFIDAAFDNALSVNLSSGGDDSVNGSASPSVITFIADNTSDITAADTLMGGTGAGDSLVLTADNGTADLANVSGVETVTVVESVDNNIGINFYNGNFTGVASGAITVNGSALNDTTSAEGILTVNAGGVTAGAFSVIGGTGSDVITTGSGADTINGGADSTVLGNDSITSGAGNDSITTGSGNDTIDAGPGSDWVNAGDGNNSVLGGIGSADTIITGSGNDTIFAGDGADTVSSGGGNDQIAGDVVDAAVGGNDTIDAGSGIDTIIGGFGKDSLTGGSGADVFMYTRRSDSSGIIATSVDVITDFVSGTTDVIDFRHIGLDATVMADWNLVPGHVIGGLNGALIQFMGNAANFADAQAAVGPNSGKVQAVFQQDEHVLWADLNDDGVLDNRDLRIVLNGISTLVAADVQDGLTMGTVHVPVPGPNPYVGTIANDSVVVDSGPATVDGGDGNDTITGTAGGTGTVTITGGAGIDTFNVTAGTATITDLGAGGSADNLVVSAGATATATATGAWTAGAGTNNAGTASVNANGNAVSLAAASVTGAVGWTLTNTGVGAAMTGSTNADTITGGAGNDTMTGGAGIDTFNVTAGTDTITDLGAGGLADNLVVSAGATATATATGAWTAGAGTNNAGTASVNANGNTVSLAGASVTGAVGWTLTNSGVAAAMTGSTNADTITGGAGNDTMTGLAGIDTFNVTAGTDTITDLGAGGLADNLVVSAGATATATATGAWTAGAGTNNAGTASVNANGNTVSLAGASVTGAVGWTLTNSGVAAAMTGSANADTITGGAGADTITGGLGNDIMTGLAGIDTFNVDFGTDTITDLGAGGLADVLVVSAGATANATMTGAWTATGATSNAGTANVTAGGFAVDVDLAIGGVGWTLTNAGNATGIAMRGSDWADTIIGGTGADTITGGTGNDIITGGLGIDTFNVDFGTDTITDLGAGGLADILVVSAGATANATMTGAWTATAATSNAGTANVDAAGNNVSVAAAIGTVGWNLTNSGGAATMIGSILADNITGGAGNDTMTGLAGIDTFNVTVGTDTITDLGAGGLADNLVVSAGATATATATGAWTAGAGTNNAGTASVNAAGFTVNLAGASVTGAVGWTLTNSGVAAAMTGSANADTITGGAGADTITGGAGDDIIVGFVGADVVNGSAGTNTLQMSATSATLNLAVDANLANIATVDFSSAVAAVTGNLTLQTEAINIIGSAFADTITAAAGGGSITGGLGIDTITLGAGVDTLRYTAIAQSQGVTVDIINTFTSLTDKININAITGGLGTFNGNAPDFGNAQMALTGGGAISAVYEQTNDVLYVDVNGDGLLTNVDLAINLVGVATLNSADIVF